MFVYVLLGIGLSSMSLSIVVFGLSKPNFLLYFMCVLLFGLPYGFFFGGLFLWALPVDEVICAMYAICAASLW